MTYAIAFFLAITLAATAGLRLFMPFLFLSISARYLHMPAPAMLSWVATNQGFLILLVATIVESAADKIPVVDHALDTMATFVKPLAGVILPVAVMSHWSPEAAWILGIAAGAPLALGAHATKAGTRAVSTATTAGVGNPIISFFEDALAVVLLVLAALAPVIAAIATLILAFYIFRAVIRWTRRRRATVRTPT